ncbi:TPA: hypothetical protein ACUUL1_004964, partial [Escherichia coli]
MRWLSRAGMPGDCCETMLLHARDKDRDDFREEEGKTGVLIIAELFSEVVVVNQPVAGGKATDITGGIRQSDWYYKYKKLSESNVR